MKSDLTIAKMRATYTAEFFCRFEMAYLNYEAGNWPIAKVMLEETRFLLGIEDGASSALLRFLQMYDNVAPKTWKGYRPFGVQAKAALAADILSEGGQGLSRQGSFMSSSGPTVKRESSQQMMSTTVKSGRLDTGTGSEGLRQSSKLSR